MKEIKNRPDSVFGGVSVMAVAMFAVLPISDIASLFATHYLMPCDTKSILCRSKK